jgi:hypothetical protein
MVERSETKSDASAGALEVLDAQVALAPPNFNAIEATDRHLSVWNQ